MPQVPPFHSVKEDRFHDNSRYGPASQITDENMREGTGGKAHCQDCEKLNQEGK